METTSKKFLNKKNFPYTQNSKLNPSLENNESRSIFPETYEDTIENVFSNPYQPEDEYAEFKDKFEEATFDIGYQAFDKAFPFERKSNHKYKFAGFNGRQNLEMDDFEIEFQAKSCKKMILIRDSSALEFREEEEFIMPYELEDEEPDGYANED